jgi:hypothetical protein
MIIEGEFFWKMTLVSLVLNVIFLFCYFTGYVVQQIMSYVAG